eukprot:1392350-Amorphochlora_amoeboformis.AAC.2
MMPVEEYFRGGGCRIRTSCRMEKLDGLGIVRYGLNRTFGANFKLLMNFLEIPFGTTPRLQGYTWGFGLQSLGGGTELSLSVLLYLILFHPPHLPPVITAVFN